MLLALPQLVTAASMTQLDTKSRPVFTDVGQPEKGYRAVSALAILSLVVGLLSMVAVASPLFGVVPLVAMVVSGVALRRIALNSDRLSGRWMAVVPLFLAPLFLGWGLSRDFSRRDKVLTHARKFGDDWLQILNRKESYVAHQLKVARKYRMDPHINLEAAYQRDENATREYTMFVGESPVKEILEAAPNARFEFEEALGHTQIGFVDTVTLQYLFESPATGKQRVWLTVRRTYGNFSDRADWTVAGISLTQP